jgi:hypothetical protein
MVKRWSNDVAALRRHVRIESQAHRDGEAVKPWSNHGQNMAKTMAKPWSNHGQTMVNRRPIAMVRLCRSDGQTTVDLRP